MRQIVIDTETTGLSVITGHRIIEIGCVELLNRQFTNNNLHFYINPERDSEENALAVHGLTSKFLSDKPKFARIAKKFLHYVRNAEIIMHNAPFDISFLDAEFAMLGLSPFVTYVTIIIDSLKIAKKLYPGRRNSLDALCDRYGISNAHRTLHGGLLDAILLAKVYLAMTREQNSLLIDINNVENNVKTVKFISFNDVVICYADKTELYLHEIFLDNLDKQSIKRSCIWRS